MLHVGQRQRRFVGGTKDYNTKIHNYTDTDYIQTAELPREQTKMNYFLLGKS